MHTASVALLWQTWGRHRWGLAATLAGLLGLIALHRTLPANLWLSETQAVVFAIPIGCAFVYVFYAFSYADLGPRARGSGVPAWMFTLPVRTWMLVAWPMLSGAAAIALLWMLVVQFILRPVGLDLPLVWPAVGLAVTLAWIQAVDWSPFGAPAKTVAAVSGLSALWYGLAREPYQPMVCWLLPLVFVFAYLAAVAGVNQARHRRLSLRRTDGQFGRLVGRIGYPSYESQEGSRIRHPFHALPLWSAHRSAHPSPARAQLWLEGRRNRLLLPVVVGCWLLLFTTLFVFAGDIRGAGTFIMFTWYVLPVLCILVGTVLGKGDVWARPFRLSAFAATRPLSSGALVLAKFRMAAGSLLLSIALLLTVSLAWGTWKGSLDALGEVWDQWFPDRTGAERGTLLLLGIVGYFGFCWLQLAGHLWTGLSGRFWVFAAVMVFYLVLVPNFMVMESGWEATHPGAVRALESAQRWFFWGAITGKLVVAGWVFNSVYQRGLWSGKVLVTVASLWALTVASLSVVFAARFADQFRGARVPVDYTANTIAIIILFSPLTRLAAAPLALAWNRHRKAG